MLKQHWRRHGGTWRASPPPLGSGPVVRFVLNRRVVGEGVGAVLYGGKSVKEQTSKCETMTCFLLIKTLVEKR